MARRKRSKTFSALPGEFAHHEEFGRVRIVDRNRVDGVHGATVRPLDREYAQLPGLGMRWVKMRELSPDKGDRGEARGGAKSQRVPIFDVVNTVNTRLQNEYDFAIHRHGCADVRRAKMAGCTVTPSYEQTATAAVAAERADLVAGGFDEESAEAFAIHIAPCATPPPPPPRAVRRRGRKRNSPDLQENTSSLQKPRGRGRLRGAVANPTNSKEDRMATGTKTRGRGRKAAEETETKPKGRSRAKAAETKAADNGNGNGRRTHEDILELVPEIVKKLKAGTTMTEIREEYGAGPVIRKALWESGYNTKGEKIEVEDISDLKGKALAKAIAGLREEGRAWPYIEIAADVSANDAKDLLEEHGYSELASGRVSTAAEEEEVEEKPKRGRGTKRGSAKAEEVEEKPKRTRGRRRSQGNPSTED